MKSYSKQLTIKQQILLMNIFYTIAALIVCGFFVSLFFLHRVNIQYITQWHLGIIIYILFMLGIAFTTLGSRLENNIKKEKTKTQIIKIFTDNNSIIDVINYANEHNIPLSFIYTALNDFDSSLFQQK